MLEGVDQEMHGYIGQITNNNSSDMTNKLMDANSLNHPIPQGFFLLSYYSPM